VNLRHYQQGTFPGNSLGKSNVTEPGNFIAHPFALAFSPAQSQNYLPLFFRVKEARFGW
jgi:hypothetical protein